MFFKKCFPKKCFQKCSSEKVWQKCFSENSLQKKSWFLFWDMCFFCKNNLRKSPGLPRAFCSWAREHFVSCARNELSSNFKGPVVAGGCHRGARQEPPPHGESGPLLKCTWNRSLSTRGGDPSPEGARNVRKVVSYRSRLEISVQQDFRQYMRTGIECSLFDF